MESIEASVLLLEFEAEGDDTPVFMTNKDNPQDPL
jgi:hypothetical protein